MGLLFVVCMECCVFPVGNIKISGGMTIGYINIFTAIVLCKCLGEIEAAMFSKSSWLLILLLNLGITIMGMVTRYFLEYGEVSNTYNFTLQNMLVHFVMMLLLSTMFWMQAKSKRA